MSSMGRKTIYSIALMAGTALAFPATAQAQEAGRSSLVAQQPGQMDQAVGQWEYLTARDDLPFASYAGFITSYPDFPKQELLQRRAEAALDEEAPSPQDLVGFFDRHAPLTNSGRARYALALASLDRPEALEVAREAWRSGTMSGPAELYMQGLFGSRFAPEDHDARMDALLWQGNYEAASRHVMRVSPAYRDTAQARLALLQGSMPQQAGLRLPVDAMRDAGYLYNLTRYYRTSGQPYEAVNLLASRAAFTTPAFDGTQFISEALAVAKSAGATQAVSIASKVDDVFAPGTDISDGSFTLRDKYTDLMWLGGTKALWALGDGAQAAP
ncbi:MAG: lytic transglycosylase domain-containing protein, partial [Qipengyuania citrea]